MKRRLAAILAADVVGFSRLMGEDEAATLAALKVLRKELFDPKAAQHKGRLIKLMGDGVLMEFASVVDAVAFAVDVQCAMRTRNAEIPESRQIQYRIGLHISDVMVEADDIYGAGVNLTARLEALAEAGGVCLSGTAFDHVRGKLDLTFETLGDKMVKNVKEPVTCHRVVLDERAFALATPVQAAPAGQWWARLDAALQGLDAARIAQLFKRWWLAAATATVIVPVIGLALWWQPWLPERDTAPLQPAAFPMPDKPSIAVLPFVNVSGETDQDHFAVGLTDDLITDLSKVSGLFVIARDSVFALKDITADAKKVAMQLGVKYVLQGSLRRAGARIRINVQLVDASTGLNVWAERYDRDYAELFALQDDVIGRIISAMAVKLTDLEEAQLARIPTKNLEAYDYYMRAEQEGVYYGDVAAYRRTLAYYRKALDLDPSFADAYAGIARLAVDVWQNNYNLLWPTAVARKIAYDAAGEALRLDPNNARAYIVLALLQLVEGRHAEATESARKAVAVRPSDAEANASLGLVLARSGLPDEAIAAVEQAIRLDPAPRPNFRLLAGVTFYMVRRYDAAVVALEVARDALPQAEAAHEYLAAAYAREDNQTLAHQEVTRLLRLFPESNLSYYEYLYADWRDEDRKHHLEGLHMAGLPAWPFGFDGREADRLATEAVAALTIGTTWTGRQRNGTTFVQEFDQAGNTAYRSENTILTGTVRVRNGRVCLKFEGYYLDRPVCGYVYRNTSPSAETPGDYVYVSPIELKYFSLQER